MENETSKKINFTMTYPRSDEYEYLSKIMIIDLDSEAQNDIASGNGFEISSPKSSNKKDMKDPNGIYPICGSGGVMGYANDYICPDNSIILGRKGNINNPIYMTQKFWNVDTAFGLSPKESLDSFYLYFFCKIFNFEQLNVAVTIPSLRKNDLLNIPIPLPPLSLQQEFAAKVEAIEAMKAKVRQSLKEAETLFNERMDYYFN